MSLTLHVDGERWRTHLRRISEERPGLVPVAKGNGYGFGNGRLARRAAWLGVDTLAVGTYAELADVVDRFPGDLLVLTPWRPFLHPAVAAITDPALAGRVLHTVSRLDDLVALIESPGRPRVVLERATSMRRHGLGARDLVTAVQLATRGEVRFEGIAMHLPLPGVSHAVEMEALLTDVRAAGASGTIWVSHLGPAELADIAAHNRDLTLRPRIGTDLWLGDRGALRVSATVLDAHRVRRGDVFGYRARTAPRAGTILVVSGGTAHGIGLESPTGEAGLRSRAATIARGGLDAAGFVRSPYTIAGKPRLFAEPPHMQASMLFLPASVTPPAIGDEIDVRVRYTATAFDEVLVS